jgi:hypothetical protein
MTTGLLRWVAALEHPDEDPQRRRKPIWLAVPLGALGLAICAALLAWLVWLPEARLWLEKSPPTSANSQAIWLTIHLLMIWAWAWLAYRVIVPWGAEGSTVADLVAPPSAALLGTVLYFDLLGLPAVTGALPALMAAGLHAALLSYLRARLLGPGRAIFWALALGLGFALTVWILRPGPSGPEAEIHQDIRLIAAANHVYAGSSGLKPGSPPPSLENLVVLGYLAPETIQPPSQDVVYLQAREYSFRPSHLLQRPQATNKLDRTAPPSGGVPGIKSTPTPIPTPTPAPKPPPVAEIILGDGPGKKPKR